ncbi:MAG: hypothetical protein Aurels2KO_09310 [Aureliella sp.]
MLARFLRHNLKIRASRDVYLAAWILLAVAAGFLAYIARTHEITHDAFHEMALFREALVAGAMPQEDVFAYTPTVDTSVHHEWGTGAVLYFATVGSGLGLAGLSALKLLLVAALWLVIYRVARMRGAHPLVFGCLALVVFPVMWVGFATVRAQLFTLVFLALQLWMHEVDARGRRYWVALWLVMLTVWLNLHAGFVVGMGLLAFHTMEQFGWTLATTCSVSMALRKHWHLLVACAGSVCVLPINPYGWKYIPYLVRAIGMPRPLIREWKPIWHTYAPEITILMLLVAIALFAVAVKACIGRTAKQRLRGAAFLAVCFYMTIKHIRHGSLLAVVWLAYVPAWLTRMPVGRLLIQSVSGNRQVAVRVCQAVVLASTLFATRHHVWRPTLPPAPLYSTACYPVGAVEYLREAEFAGNLLTPFHVGAYVSWEMYPAVKVSFDGRYEVAYQHGVMEEHNKFLSAEPGWAEFLDRFPTDAILVHRQAPAFDALLEISRSSPDGPQQLSDWTVVYQDDSFLIAAPDDLQMPVVDKSGQPMNDGAWQAFADRHSHHHRLTGSSTTVRRVD